MNQTVIPHDFEAEQAILGSLIEENELIEKVANILTPKTFHVSSHRYIFKSILELSSQNKAIDEISLGDQLKSLNQLEETGGYIYLAEIVGHAPSSGNIVEWAIIIQEHAILRDLIQLTSDIGRKARDPEQNVSQLLMEAQDKILQITEVKTADNIIHIKNVLMESFKELEKRSVSREDEVVGISTGFVDLDKIINGLIAPDLIIIAARTSMGKTALALNIVEYIYSKEEKRACAIFSREMSNRQMVMRMLSSSGKVDGRKIATGQNFEQDDWDKLAATIDNLGSSPIFLDEKTDTIQQIGHELRMLNRKHKEGLGLAVVDYIQLVKGTKENREQEIAEITRGLKNLCKELNIPILALSQLNRALEKRSNKRPELSDLRESGAIEQDADIIMFIYRDEVYDDNSPDRGIAEIIIKKHRNGPIGIVKLRFTSKFTRFSNLSLQRF